MSQTQVRAALDTSGIPTLAIAGGDAGLHTEAAENMDRRSDGNLALWLAAACRRAGVEVTEVSQWLVGTGPGSFSGIRVGIALLEGICLAGDMPLIGVPSSVALALEACRSSREPLEVAVLHDARRGQVIVTRFAWSGGPSPGLRMVSEAAVRDPDSLFEDDIGESVLLSPHAAVADYVPAAVRSRLRLVPRVEARWLLEAEPLGWGQTPTGPTAAIEPVYVRPAVFVKPRPPRESRR